MLDIITHLPLFRLITFLSIYLVTLKNKAHFSISLSLHFISIYDLQNNYFDKQKNGLKFIKIFTICTANEIFLRITDNINNKVSKKFFFSYVTVIC